MARNIASEIKNVNFAVKLSFLFNSENSVIHSYLYNNTFYRTSCDPFSANQRFQIIYKNDNTW